MSGTDRESKINSASSNVQNDKVHKLFATVLKLTTNYIGDMTVSDISYIKKSINSLSDEFINSKPLVKLAPILTAVFTTDLKKQRKKRDIENIAHNLDNRLIETRAKSKHESTTFNVHDLIKAEIGTHSENAAQNLILDDVPLENPVDIDTIFGTRDVKTIQSIFNPAARSAKTYIVLDRRYQSQTIPNNSLFRWDIASHRGSSRNDKFLGTHAPLKDITKIRIYPFLFPNTTNALNDQQRLSIEIKELNIQSFNAIEQSKHFHFLPKITATGSGTYDPHFVCDVSDDSLMFHFYKPIMQLESISLVFGNPFFNLTLDPDLLTATAAAYGGGKTSFTFTQAHRLPTTSTIYVSGFNTSSPAMDSNYITQINQDQGWTATVINTTLVTIPLDISTLDGFIIGTVSVYLNAKRFVIPIEFTYRG